MKPNMKQSLFALVATSALLFSGSAFAAQKTVKIEVTGLYCASCPYIAAQAIQSIKSATITDGFYDQKNQMAQFVVQYDDAQTTLDALTKATVEYGYPAKIIPTGNGNS